MVSFSFSKGEFDAVAAAASKDVTRYNLCSVRLEHGALVATDGHRVHRILTDPVLNETTTHIDTPSRDMATGEYTPANTCHIGLDDVKRIQKTMRKGDTCRVSPMDDETGESPFDWVAHISGGASIPFRSLDVGEWIDYHRVIPKGREHAYSVTFNARYLLELCKAAVAIADVKRGDPVPIRLHHGGEFEPTHVFQKGSGFDAVLMPMTDRDD